MAEEAYVHDAAPAETTAAVEHKVPADEDKEDRLWQQRLLPLMAGMVIALTVFFFLVTLAQLAFLQWSILRSPPIEISPALSEAAQTSNMSFEELYQLRQFEILAAMERYTAEKRYHQASVLLMSALWLRYLGFVTGMILALIGATFILGKMREPEQEVEGNFSQVTVALRTTSPGIILAVLGVILMLATMMDRDDLGVTDANIYLQDSAVTTETFSASDTPSEAPGELRTLPEIPDIEDAPPESQ